MELNFHPAIELGVQVWGYIAAIWLVLWIIMKLSNANKVIENAKNIPGGMNYQEPAEVDEENEELGYRAHA